MRVGRVGVVQAPKRFIISAVDSPAVGGDELMKFVAGQHQCQSGLIHHATITGWLCAGRQCCPGGYCRKDRPSVLGCSAGGRSATLKLWLAQDPEADKLLAESPFALLVGMVLDQQIPLERAFAGPKTIADRVGDLDPAEIADYDPDKFAALCSEKPAIHRFPGSMAKRIQTLARIIVDDYDGDAAAIWTAGDPDGPELLRRLKALPGFGEQKARIFLALLGKQYAVTPKGWRAAAGDFGKAGTHISVADIADARSLDKVRSYKKEMKAAKSAPQQ